ncbi:S1C family serine protease [Streptomyces tsukubensis]|uniref:S1C family serine protease n=1 Tax=Streptomyces tsukubensis TaxID=83656 RepID=UPI00344D0262
MSTEYEGTEGPAQQSGTPATPPVPPVPPVAPDGPPPAPAATPAPAPGASAPVPPAAAPGPEAEAAPPAQQPGSPDYPAAPAHGSQAPAPAVPQDYPSASAPVAPPTAPPASPQSADWAAPPALPPYGGGEGPVWGAAVPPADPKPRRRKRVSTLVTAILVAALVAGGVGGAAGYWAASDRDEDSSSTTITSTEIPKDLKREPGTVAAVAAKALPSVVTIEAKSGREGGGAELPGGGGSGGGTGTGFVYDQQGHILTNNHVVASAAEGGTLAVTFSDGRTYDAEVIGRAQGYDVAVLKLKNPPSGLTPLALGDSEKVAVGDSTIAIGAPFGLSNTVTTGIISAKNRPVASGGEANSKVNSYMSALQTDASINPGNSGGPLLDARGAVIGINSAIQSTGNGLGQAGSIGLGFAIPINQAKNVAEQLIKTGKPVYPVIGATVDVSGAPGGARIPDKAGDGGPAVPPTGPAAKAGLKALDVITEFNGKPVDSGPTLISEIWNHKPGDKVTLTFERDGKESKTTLTLGSRTGDSS